MLSHSSYVSCTCRSAAARRNLASLMILVSAKPCKGLCPLAASSIYVIEVRGSGDRGGRGERGEWRKRREMGERRKSRKRREMGKKKNERVRNCRVERLQKT